MYRTVILQFDSIIKTMVKWITRIQRKLKNNKKIHLCDEEAVLIYMYAVDILLYKYEKSSIAFEALFTV